MYWECPHVGASMYPCNQTPICKGCLEPCLSTGAPIWEWYCGNKDCKRTQAENVRDLFDPRCQVWRIIDMTNPPAKVDSQGRLISDRPQVALALERRMNNCFHCGTQLIPWEPQGGPATDHKWCTNCCWVVFNTILALLDEKQAHELLVETQRSVHQWTNEVYPQYSTKERRAIALIEEAVELGLAAGLNVEDIHNVVQLPITKFEKTGDRGDDGEELGDVMLCVYAYGGQTEKDAHEELDKKMRHNRSKPLQHFQAKYQKKLEQGLELDMRHKPEGAH